ncbi:hypothetical protein H5410_016493 [Solanum commersonii]|uniref:Uncharacterized protein n=1 Tax=Solanum commersonii TaxID=4109 RepID=A0A9J5ZWD7_SOLCO|nr:hypothetical protein H5410_016493 [Solanum commersonii]
MDLEKKIWAASTVLFLTVGIAALGHTAWLVCTVVAILLGRLDGGLLHLHTPTLDPAENNPHVDIPLFVLMSTASYFCVLMMVRPLATDFGIYSMDSFGTGRQTWLAFGLCTLMIFLQLIMERQAVVHVAARRDQLEFLS